MKFGRLYQLLVEGESKDWTVGMPFTCRFSVSATGTPTANVAHFYLYNLPEAMRNDLVKDIFDGISPYRRLSFLAGYASEPQLPAVFVGNLFWAYSYRQGPDWITELNALDGGYAIEQGDITYNAPAGTSYQQLLRVLAQALPGISIGVLSDRLGIPDTARGVVLSGQPWGELLKRILPVKAQLFINQETLYVLAQDEYVPNPDGLTELTEDTGLIGSPRRQASMTIVTMVFEPRVQVGQKITFRSQQPYAGDHKVMLVEHHGTISPAVCDEAITTLTFFRTPQVLVEAGVGNAAEAVA